MERFGRERISMRDLPILAPVFTALAALVAFLLVAPAAYAAPWGVMYAIRAGGRAGVGSGWWDHAMGCRHDSCA